MNIALFFVFLVQVLCLGNGQNQPVNLLNPMQIGKSPLVTYALNEYLNATAANDKVEIVSIATVPNAAVKKVAKNSTWAILVAGSSGWMNYRYVLINQTKTPYQLV